MAKDTNMPTLGAPLVLLATLWGAVAGFSSAFQHYQRSPDKIFALIEECGRCEGKLLGPLKLYLTNLLPLSLGICLFVLNCRRHCRFRFRLIWCVRIPSICKG